MCRYSKYYNLKKRLDLYSKTITNKVKNNLTIHVQCTLHHNHLSPSRSGFNCQNLFLIPSHILYKTVTLLLSGAAIDREDHKVMNNIKISRRSLPLMSID